MSTISDQKKRTLEALQQRYTSAKAKKLQDEKVKSQKKSNFNTPKPNFDAPREGKGPEITPRGTYIQPSRHKGFVFFIILFYATRQGFVYQNFPTCCCCISGVAFSSSNYQQKPSTSSGTLPLYLYVIKCMAVYLCNKYFELCR
jgi:ribonuclease P protein subunit POP4